MAISNIGIVATVERISTLITLLGIILYHNTIPTSNWGRKDWQDLRKGKHLLEGKHIWVSLKALFKFAIHANRVTGCGIL